MGESFPRKLCGWCLTISDGKSGFMQCCGKSDRMIRLFKNERNRNKAGVVTGSTDCPSCGSSGDLSIIGSQAASLISAGISQLYSTPYNDDNKLLARLRSGYLPRAASFLLITHLVLDPHSALWKSMEGWLEPNELPEKFHDYWLNELGEGKLGGSVSAPDLDWLDEYEKWWMRAL